jgi:uncharacterized protein with PIN domain
MTTAQLERPHAAGPFAPEVRRCPECTVPLTKLDAHGAQCAAGHSFRRVGDLLVPRDHRAETG